jgi:hypothetical protein
VLGVAIDVVKIGDSEPAPNFELVAQPNDWEKLVKKVAAVPSSEASAKALVYGEFLEGVLDRIRAEHRTWSRARTSDQNWCNTSIGTSGVNLSMVWPRTRPTAQIYFEAPDADLNMARFERLYQRREAFEARLGETAEWDAMEGDGRPLASSSPPASWT